MQILPRGLRLNVLKSAGHSGSVRTQSTAREGL
jgi:hypothetical protein